MGPILHYIHDQCQYKKRKKSKLIHGLRVWFLKKKKMSKSNLFWLGTLTHYLSYLLSKIKNRFGQGGYG